MTRHYPPYYVYPQGNQYYIRKLGEPTGDDTVAETDDHVMAQHIANLLNKDEGFDI